jgi:hypothetical protein
LVVFAPFGELLRVEAHGVGSFLDCAWQWVQRPWISR